MNYADFVSKNKSFIIAPAGYGKTHSIAVCLKHTQGKQLILTHTHAGVASLKEKIRSLKIKNAAYRIETITGFAQKYVCAFYCGNNIPPQESNKYYSFIIDKAAILLTIPVIQDVVKATYSGLFVDEYQDCNLGQHNLIEKLADMLPTRIFGDHLQGIFDFKDDDLVDFGSHLSGFEKFPELTVPWRWKNSNKPKLGECLVSIRKLIEQTKSIDLSLYEPIINVYQINEDDKYIPQSKYNKKIWNLSKEDNLLIIHPDSSNLATRRSFTKNFNNSFILLESLDSKDFYKFSKELDKVNKNNFYRIIYALIPKLFNGKSSRDKWFNSKRVVNKQSEDEKALVAPISDAIDNLEGKISFKIMSEIFKKVKELPGMKCYRQELLWNLCDALERAECNDTLVYDEMKEIRNRKRRGGREISGRCIGTTLLTKGLEFDTVAVLDAHKFKCCKNFYVAITRASKKLIIFTNNKVLYPYS